MTTATFAIGGMHCAACAVRNERTLRKIPGVRDANVNLGTMFGVFLLASAAATLGGLDSPLGAVVGGLSLGVVESLVTNYPNDWWGSTYIGPDTALAVAFLIILVVLLVRPSGLFGSTRVERV